MLDDQPGALFRLDVNCIRIANGFSMRVIAHDVYENEPAARELGFTYLPLEEVLGQSDFVSLNVALDETTQHLINAESLALGKPGAIRVNTARGAVVDTQALIEALRSGQLGAAGLDVLEAEPDTYHDFSGLNVVVTPHLGWYTDGAVGRILAIALAGIEGFLRGEQVNRVC